MHPIMTDAHAYHMARLIRYYCYEQAVHLEQPFIADLAMFIMSSVNKIEWIVPVSPDTSDNDN